MQSNTARTSDFRKILDMETGTSVMRAISLVLPRDDGDDGDSPSHLPDSSAAIVDGVMQASYTTP